MDACGSFFSLRKYTAKFGRGNSHGLEEKMVAYIPAVALEVNLRADEKCKTGMCIFKLGEEERILLLGGLW